MIRPYTPMAPTLVRAPFHRVGWVYEEKVDGYRMLAYKDGAHVLLLSRKGVDHIREGPQVSQRPLRERRGASKRVTVRDNSLSSVPRA